VGVGAQLANPIPREGNAESLVAPASLSSRPRLRSREGAGQRQSLPIAWLCSVRGARRGNGSLCLLPGSAPCVGLGVSVREGLLPAWQQHVPAAGSDLPSLTRAFYGVDVGDDLCSKSAARAGSTPPLPRLPGIPWVPLPATDGIRIPQRRERCEPSMHKPAWLSSRLAGE
jgi:hypothetical protein